VGITKNNAQPAAIPYSPEPSASLVQWVT